MSMIGVYVPETNQRWKWSDIPANILAPELALSMDNEDEDYRRYREIHVSDLVGCLHRRVREKLVDYYIPLEAAYRMMRGKAWDAFCCVNNLSRKDVAYQLHLTLNFHGTEIKGTPDVVDFVLQSVEDYKAPTRKMYEDNISDAYVWQLNIYRFMADRLIKRPDWKGTKSLFLNVCGPTIFQRIEVLIKPDKEVEEFLKNSLLIYRSLLDGGMVGDCEDSGCFYCRSKALFVNEIFD